MNKAYKRINWENYPSDATPLNEANLNKLDSATDTLDDRVITLETTKATKTEVATLVADVTFEESTGIITITKKNGSKVTIDTQMEKIAVNFDYNPTTQQIILTLIDGTKQYIDLSALITQYEFLDTDTVAFIIGTDGKVSAIVKEGSIEEKHLEPNYLAKIKVESAKAQASQESAATSATNAASSATTAESYATGGTGTRDGEDADNAKYYSERAKAVYEELQGEQVTGVKGAAETEYRNGNVNLTPEDIGALPENGTAASATKAEQDGNGQQIDSTYIKSLSVYGDTITYTKGDGTSGKIKTLLPDVGAGLTYTGLSIAGATTSMTISHGNSVTAGTAGTSSATSGATLAVPYVTYDAQGHVTKSGTHTHTITGFALSNHTHSYLPLAGGTLTGKLNVNNGIQICTGGGFLSEVNLKMENSKWLKTYNTAGTETALIGLNSSNNVHMGDYGANVSDVYLHAKGVQYNFADTGFAPEASNAQKLGTSSKLWSTVYAKTGSINTSDRTKKHDIYDLTEEYEKLFLMLQPKSFIFNDGDRVHIGAISQDVEDAMQKLGIEPEKFAGFCKDIRYEYTEYNEEDGTPVESSKVPCKDEDGNIIYDYALRYQEFIFLTIHMVQKLWARTEALENENREIKEQLQSMQQDIAELKKS